ncbi:MAG: hypothetical protein U5L02_01830 [Rheinheimera sp.]|nr:hypothetical protein [Rheinheimera sp.]
MSECTLPVLPDPCPLCLNPATAHYHTDKIRQYWHCPVCELVYASRLSLLASDAELAYLPTTSE